MFSESVPRDYVVVARKGRSHRWERTGEGLGLEELGVKCWLIVVGDVEVTKCRYK